MSNNAMSEDRMWEIAMIAKESYMYKAGDYEALLIIAVGSLGQSEYYFHAEGTTSGEEYQVWYEDVDLRSDKFYKLVEVQHGY